MDVRFFSISLDSIVLIAIRGRCNNIQGKYIELSDYGKDWRTLYGQQ